MRYSILALFLLNLVACMSITGAVTEPFRKRTYVADGWTGRDCGVVSGAEYCVYETAPNPQQTVFFFHGLLDDVRVLERSLNDESRLGTIFNGLGPIRVVVVSFGLSWMITPYSDRSIGPEQATIANFKNNILPHLEKTYNLPKPFKAVGRSMGGSNLSVICAALPELFERCALLNPMLVSDNVDPWLPFWLNKDWRPSFIIINNYEDLARWQANRPSAVMRSARAMPPVYVTACKNDDFGLYEGPIEWAEMARKKGVKVTLELVENDCDHYKWPAEGVRRFLAE